jgi:hypothetical protein
MASARACGGCCALLLREGPRGTVTFTKVELGIAGQEYFEARARWSGRWGVWACHR